jgi:hypothetical protein
MTIMTLPAARPTIKVKLAMESPQETWSVIAVTILPSRTWTAQARGPTSAMQVNTNIQA